MISVRTLLATASIAAILGGCSTVDYKNVQATGSDFDKELYTGYRSLADAEVAEGDYRDGDTFGMRAVEAASGKAPAPESISARDLPKDKVGELTAAREQLMAVLRQGAADKLAKDAAMAQVSFDCWMQEQEENFQPDDIAKCRTGFVTAMARIDAGMKQPMAKAPAPKMETSKAVVYFDFNSATLSKDAEAAIVRFKEGLKPGAKVMLSGYTDRAGASGYNEVLAAKRAKTVYSVLESLGVKGDIGVAAYGETRNAKPTPDGVREQLNRRVEISVTQ